MAKKRTNHEKTKPAGNDNDRGTAQYADQHVTTGAGGEVHQTDGGTTPVLTTQQGIPVADDQNSLRVGVRGPTALEDFHLREKIFHFDHERIPERVVHARGFGVHGYFENYESLADGESAEGEIGRCHPWVGDVLSHPGPRLGASRRKELP